MIKPLTPSFFNQAALVDDLWKEMTTTGFSNRSKNDFYDFVLYLLNKYDKNHFLSENDNADNERLLKTKAEKIKESKKLISVKFMDDVEYNSIFLDFIKRISRGNIPNLNDDGSSYTMVIEDTVLRSAIEARLKRTSNITLTYERNTELVTINHEAFLKMLTAEISGEPEDSDGQIKTLLEDTVKTLKDKKTKQNTKKTIDKVIEALVGLTPMPDSLKSLGTDALQAVSHCAWEKIIEKRKKEM